MFGRAGEVGVAEEEEDDDDDEEAAAVAASGFPQVMRQQNCHRLQQRPTSKGSKSSSNSAKYVMRWREVISQVVELTLSSFYDERARKNV